MFRLRKVYPVPRTELTLCAVWSSQLPGIVKVYACGGQIASFDRSMIEQANRLMQDALDYADYEAHEELERLQRDQVHRGLSAPVQQGRINGIKPGRYDSGWRHVLGLALEALHAVCGIDGVESCDVDGSHELTFHLDDGQPATRLIADEIVRMLADELERALPEDEVVAPTPSQEQAGQRLHNPWSDDTLWDPADYAGEPTKLIFGATNFTRI